MAEDSNYILEPIREGADFALYRGRERGNSMPILAVAVAAEQPPQAIGSLFCVLGFEPNGRWFFWKSRRFSPFRLPRLFAYDSTSCVCFE
jgi:hypothetical protein